MVGMYFAIIKFVYVPAYTIIHALCWSKLGLANIQNQESVLRSHHVTFYGHMGIRFHCDRRKKDKTFTYSFTTTRRLLPIPFMKHRNITDALCDPD